MKIEISSDEAARTFSDCLARVERLGDTLVITRNDQPVAELGPVLPEARGTLGDFLSLWKRDPDDPAFADDLERANSKELPSANPWAS
jgi:antitoxin (DNA-binding transcriptional repressor) of toxin-antitoxin stability system